MSKFLVNPELAGPASEPILSITPQSANWNYVGFAAYCLAAGNSFERKCGEREELAVILSGQAQIIADGKDLGTLGRRQSVFERDVPPAAAYIPAGKTWSAQALGECEIAVCHSPGGGDYPVRAIAPEDTQPVTRGVGANTRLINPILMEEKDWAHSLLVTEVYTPSGNWSSYPPHRHDEDAFPSITNLEEVYYFRFSPAQGYGHQRIYTDADDNGLRELDETLTVHNRHVSLVPRGYHPCAAPYGYEMYYLNVMAGPMRRWRFANDPDHDWIAKRDAQA